MATDLDRPNSGPRTAKHAVLVPLAILGVMVLFIGLLATLFLWNNKSGALALAAVAAGGILFSVSLISSRDRLDGRQRFVAVGAGVLPLVLGGLVAVGAIGGIEDEDRNINVQPLLIRPDDAPLIAAQDSNDFCLPDEAGGCETTQTWEFAPSAEEETVAFVFDNLEVGVPHNVVITTLVGSEDDPQPGEDLLASTVIDGPNDEYYVSDVPLDDLPEQFYFFCAIHPNMNGVGTLVADDAA
ncbi:cupredoxin domain-containing protein [Nitriliruptor alkaliphilus]|uniref:cupredoxin domain-containing protein n=1 Tax=Nitriliruptor alkaliphilus TaxID=427918 RepID=UPI0006965B4D|nr:hypothetical protein [Nitriliruptor alkaliphilus]